MITVRLLFDTSTFHSETYIIHGLLGMTRSAMREEWV
jgi:hypothetical protein